MRKEPGAAAQISLFKPADVEALQQLIYNTIDLSYAGVYGSGARQFFKEYHSRDNILRDAGDGYTIVAICDGELAGTGTLVGEDIRRVFIQPGFQRRGIGRIIMGNLENKARCNGLQRVSLSASLPAQRFYRGLGYVATGEGCDFFYGDPLRYLEMAKEI